MFLHSVLPIVLQPESGVFESVPKRKLGDINLSPGSHHLTAPFKKGKKTEKEKVRKKDRKAERQKDRKKERQKDRKAERQKKTERQKGSKTERIFTSVKQRVSNIRDCVKQLGRFREIRARPHLEEIKI